MAKKFQWILRCKDKDSLNDIKDGIIRFSSPKFWQKAGRGVNDIYEGTIAIINDLEKHYVRECPKIHEKVVKNETILYDERIFEVPCICFYGIEAKKGMIVVPNEYFTDFIGEDKNKYGLIIIDANDLFRRLNDSLLKLGFEEKDLFPKSIEYLDIHNIEKIIEKRKIPFPHELTFKDHSYSHQNELRFYIISENEKALAKLMGPKNEGGQEGYLYFDATDLCCIIDDIPFVDEQLFLHQEENGTLNILHGTLK